MLEGKYLGDAIESARIRKGVTKKAMADFFEIKPPSIQDWVKHGRIKKDKLLELFRYFSDVAGPEHWGLTPLDSDLGYLFYRDTLAKLSPEILEALRDLSSQSVETQKAAAEEILNVLERQPQQPGSKD
jgi:hypothetical protein